MTRRVYVSEIEGGNARGRPPVKWSDRVQEYIREREERSLETLSRQGGSVWIEKVGSHPLVGGPRSRHQ